MNINKFDILALSNNKKIVVLDKINFMNNDFLFFRNGKFPLGGWRVGSVVERQSRFYSQSQTGI